jgi:hypothetical protein
MLQCNVPSSHSLSHFFPTSIAWYPGVGLAEAYLRKVPVAQRKTYLYHQERVPYRPPPLAAPNSSEVCSGSQSPCVAEEESGSSLDAPTSRSQICGKWYKAWLVLSTTFAGPHHNIDTKLA